MATPLQKSALDAVRLFRTKEIAGLSRHLRKFGPLPEPPASANAAPTPVVTLPNPFLPKKHPKMRKWVPPKYSLRRQAELVKLAQASNTMALLPPGPKKLAAELRAERVKAALPLAQRALEEKMAALKIQPQQTVDERKAKKDLEQRITSLGKSLDSLREILKAATAEYDLGELASFEAESGESLTKEQVAERRAEQEKRERTKLLFENRVKRTENLITKANKQLAHLSRSRERKPENTAWKEPIFWAGAFKEKKVPGSELGTRLYTGKRRMFKGHLWERQQARRARRHSILMRDMPARLERYKSYYKKRRPNPLKPSRYTKPPKLPY
ncbi:hypothetical protein CVT25_010583 [Psilocybe cyanescens]|uniref:Large ribosomal subunit protein mL59 domain-containing protein n=1 Tax=Psilocybe cyanescens TaxID=93625 RepID=A0A409WJF2_PSICY|nr:hypothetical protein CVT25_010583 [Psilocybe cyanescens]